MRACLVAGLILAGVGSAMAADAYDTIYVSDEAVCERADEADMSAVLFELQASAVAPRSAIWVQGELVCDLVNETTHRSPIAETDADVEIFATARCHGAYADFSDQLVLTSVSQNINLANGDSAETPPARLEVMSMRADIGGDDRRQTDGYAGLYTQCDALMPESFAWPE